MAEGTRVAWCAVCKHGFFEPAPTEVGIAIAPPPPECLIGIPIEGESDVHGLELTAQRELARRAHWQPYVGLGARLDYGEYVDLQAVSQSLAVSVRFEDADRGPSLCRRTSAATPCCASDWAGSSERGG